MQNKEIHCQDFSRALLISADHLEKHQDILNNLNVFPVPDGDTGSNMAATFIPAVRELNIKSVKSCRDIASMVLPSFSHNSRGNSGFILSRFFKGFFSNAQTREKLCAEFMAQGFSRGLYEVNSSLFNPKAGTMVTIIEAMSRVLEEQKSIDLNQTLEAALNEARKVLNATPQMLPLLARAGVIDSGALGFIIIFEGLLAGLQKKDPPSELESSYRFEPSEIPIDSEAEEELSGQFCIELIIKKNGSSTKDLNGYLKTIGSSIALVNDTEMIKLHIHSDYPEKIINKMKDYGELDWQKVEDMHLQIQGNKDSSEMNPQNEVLLFSPGSGFTKIFKEMGLEHIIEYSVQLPSAGEILKVLKNIASPNVIILPNNGNILPSCQEASDRSGKNLYFISTTNIIQGLVCCYGYSENEDLENNLQAMRDSLDFAQSLFIYRSGDNRVFDGKSIAEKDYFVLQGNELKALGKEPVQVIWEAFESIDLSCLANITIFYKSDKELQKLTGIHHRLEQTYPDIELEILPGGQHQADWIISLE